MFNQKEYDKKYYEKHKEYIKEKSKNQRKKNIDYFREYDKKYYQKNIERKKKYRIEHKEDSKKWQSEHKEQISERMKKYYKENKENIKKRSKKRAEHIRNNIVNLISDNNPHCIRCGCNDIRLLEINHKNGGGNKERQRGKSTMKIYRDIYSRKRKTNDLEILCRVCNARHYLELKYGELPYKISYDSSIEREVK